jgi:SAM-dependent methyltransferase
VLDDLLLRDLRAGAHILDLCCGTGQLLQQLSERGYRMTGVDGSEHMLEFARSNAPSAALILADARDFILPQPVDAVVSTSDSLNHLTEPQSLLSAFRCVHRALVEGGRFVFDMNTEEKYRLRWIGSYGIVDDDQACIVHASYDRSDRMARFDATLFFQTENKTSTWRREDLAIFSRCYSEEEVSAALADAGFGDVTVYDWQRDLSPDGEPDKFFVVARK